MGYFALLTTEIPPWTELLNLAECSSLVIVFRGRAGIYLNRDMNVNIKKPARKNVARKLKMMQETSSSGNNMDPLVHPTFASIRSSPHSGQTAFLFLQNMDPVRNHGAVP